MDFFQPTEIEQFYLKLEIVVIFNKIPLNHLLSKLIVTETDSFLKRIRNHGLRLETGRDKAIVNAFV